MTVGPLDEPAPVGESEYGGDSSVGWTGDLGVAKGHELTAAEKAVMRKPPVDDLSGIDPHTGLPIPDE